MLPNFPFSLWNCILWHVFVGFSSLSTPLIYAYPCIMCSWRWGWRSCEKKSHPSSCVRRIRDENERWRLVFLLDTLFAELRQSMMIVAWCAPIFLLHVIVTWWCSSFLRLPMCEVSSPILFLCSPKTYCWLLQQSLKTRERWWWRWWNGMSLVFNRHQCQG